jgi:hypothetical protein
MEPTEEQMERAVTALLPYVHEWNLSLNPEDIYELAGAVLQHFDSEAPFEAIAAGERADRRAAPARSRALLGPHRRRGRSASQR